MYKLQIMDESEFLNSAQAPSVILVSENNQEFLAYMFDGYDSLVAEEEIILFKDGLFLLKN